MRPAGLVLVASSITAGCLPLGSPPEGQHLLDDRTLAGVEFAPGPGGTPSRLIAKRVTSEDPLAPLSLYAVQGPTTGAGLGTETLLADRVGGALRAACTSALCPPSTDSQGRMFVVQPAPSMGEPAGLLNQDSALLRVDPLTGATTSFGSMSRFVGLFADRTALAYTVASSLRVRDAADQEAAFDHVGTTQVMSDALYFLTYDRTAGGGTLRRSSAPPFDSPETVATDLDGFAAFPGDTPILTFCRSMAGDTDCRWSVFDPATGQETPLPGDGPNVWSISPTGRYLFRVAYPRTPGNDATTTLLLFDRETGSEQSATVTQLGMTYWRPGHDELWFDGTAGPAQALDGPDQRRSLWRWVPGADALAAIPDGAAYRSFAGPGRSPFTSDGRFVLAFPTTQMTDKPTVSIRSADDPTTALLILNPAGTGLQDMQELPDGRLIVSDWITDTSRCDIYLVDVDAATMRPLGHAGNVLATGATRILAQLDWLAGGGSGTLSLIDLATGATTRLAENVNDVAIDPVPGSGADALAPGTRVAYLSRNRVSSPYDGLWITTLP